MSPYEVRLLIEIDVGLVPLTVKSTPLLGDTICDFVTRGLIKAAKDATLTTAPLGEHDWETTKLGRAVCNRFCSVNESGIKFCGECGQQLK